MRTTTITTLLKLLFCLVLLSFPVTNPGTSGAASQKKFERWLETVRVRALEEGITASVLNSQLSGLKLDTQVLRNAENQAEFTTPYTEYRGYFLTRRMIEEGKRLKEKYRSVLRELERRYGVPAEILIAIWGVESRFGEKRSRYNVIPSLASMAYGNPSRRKYFTGELIAVLRLIDRGEVRRQNLRSSWAGALGQPQFMPSSYMSYAVDFDGDGYRDIWETPADVLASIGNYLEENGWDRSGSWGRKLEDGETTDEASLYEPRGTSEQFHRGANFSVLLSYNQSNFYAITVGLLSEKIGGLEDSGRMQVKH